MKRTLLPLLAIVIGLAGPSSLLAADNTWTGNAGGGTDPNWSNAGNWTPGAPVNGDNLIFSGFSQVSSSNDIVALSLGWVRFDAGSFMLNGLGLAMAGGLTNTAGDNAFTLPVTNAAAQTWDMTAGTSVGLSNTLSLAVGTLSLAVEGNLVLGGSVSGAGGVAKNGSGTVTFSAINSYTGGLVVNAGVANSYSPNAAGSGAVGGGNLIVNNGGTVNANGDNAIFGQGGTLAPPRSVTINAGGTIATGDRSGHVPALILNGGTLSGGTARNDYGNWNLDYGVSTLTNGSVSSISGGNVTLGQTGGTVFNIGTGDTVEVSSIIARTSFATDAGLIKNGSGSLLLTAANTYASATTINAGRLALANYSGTILNTPLITVLTNGVFDVTGVFGFSVATNQTLAGSGKVVGSVGDDNAGSVISPGGNGAPGNLTIDSLALNGNLALNFDLSANAAAIGGVNDLLTVTNLTLSAYLTNTVNLSALAGSLAQGTPYTLIKYTSCSAPAGAVTTLATPPSHFVYAFNNDTANSRITVTVTGNPFNLVWRGDGKTNAWDITTTTNWLVNGVTPDLFYDGDNTTFNDSGSNSPQINITTTVKPTTATVNATKDYTFGGAGKISGGARLVKSGSGTLTITTDNDFNGGTTVSAGTLAIGTGGGTGNLAAGNGTNNSRIIVNRTGTMTSGANLTGTGSLTLVNNGTVNLTGSNSFTGGTLVNNGSLQIGNSPPVAGASIAGPITNYSAVYFGRSDAFTLQSPITSTGNTFLNGPGQLYLRTTAGMTVDGTAGIDLAGTLSVSQDVPGRLFVAPGGSINLGGEILIGNPGSISGELIQTGGTVNVGNRIRLGHWGTLAAYYRMGGGTLNVANTLNVGWDGTGLFFMTNGTVNCLALAVDGNGNTGALGGTNETFSLTGGRINIGIGGITTGSTDGGYGVLLGGGTVGASGSWSSSLNMSLTNGAGVTFDTAENTITLSGIISGTNGLTKQGGGYLNLNNAANTYTGPTTVAQGTLQGSGSVASPITVQSGAALSAGTTLATGTLTVSNGVTVSPGASLVFDASTTAATSDRIDVRGTLALNPAGTPAYFNFIGARPFTGGAYTVISNLVPRTGSLTVVNPTRYAVAVDETNPNRIQVNFTGTNATLVWKGNVNNLWNVNGAANWLNLGVGSTYYQSDAVIFDGTGLGTPNVTLASEMSPLAITVNSTGDYTFSGAGIAGLGTLTKSGAGKLTLANNNTYTGVTSVGAGTLQIGNGGTTGSMVGGIVANSAVVFNRSDASTYAGVISGSGTLTQAGAGKLTLSGNSSHTGGTLVNPGSTLQVGAGLNSGTAGVGPINVPATASLVFSRNDSPTIANQLTGSGAISFNGPGSTGAGSGQGSYTLSATNTFNGTVTLSQARLSPANAFALGTVGTYIVPVNSTLWPNIAGAVFTPSLNLSGSGWPENGGYIGALRLGSGCTWAGNITLSGNTRISAMTDANDNRITGTISGGAYEADFGAPGGTGLLTLAPSAPNTFGALRISPGTLVASNANAIPSSLPLVMNGGTLRLNGNNFTAATFVSLAGGIIQNGSATTPCTVTLNMDGPVTYAGTFADFSTAPLSVVKNGAGTLTLSGLSTSLGGVTVNAGGLALNAGGANGVVRGTLTANPGTTILSLNNDSLGYNGGATQVTNLVLNGATMLHTPNNNLTIWNNAVVTMTGAYFAATNTGGAGRLDFGTGASLTTLPSAVSSTIAGANLYLRQADTVFTVAEGAAADDLVISAPINQAAANFGITKAGPGRLRITGAIAYGGATTIKAGSVVLGPGTSLATATNTITVAAGATLDASGSATAGLPLNSGQILTGSGTIVGNVMDNVGTAIQPGSSAGTLTINGNLTLGGYGTLDYELANVTTIGGGVNDLIQVNGNLSLTDFAPTVINFTFLNGAPAATAYTILKYTGTLTGTVPGAVTNAAGYTATFSHNVGAKAIQVSFTAPLQNLVWEGDGVGNAWDLTTTSLTWYNGSVSTNFAQLDTVRFDDTRTTVNTTVNINDAVKPAAITLDSTNAYTFTGAGRISGATTVTKNNTNTVTFGNANDFSGPVNINAGLLKSGNAVALPNNAKVTIASGAAFDYAGFGDSTTRNYSFTIAGDGPDGAGAIQDSGAAIYGSASASNINLSANASVGGIGRWDIGSGAAGMSFFGNGFTLAKVGVNQITFRPELATNIAAIVIKEGTLNHEGFNRTNAATLTTTNYVNTNAVLTSYGTLTLNYPVVFRGGTFDNQNSTATWTGPFTLESNTVATVGNPINVWGNVSGPGALAKLGLSTLTLTNANTYSGGTIISNAPATQTNSSAAAGFASIIVAHPNALGSGPVTLDLSLVTTNTATNTVRPLEFRIANAGIVPNDIVLPSAPITNVGLQGRDATSIYTLSGKLTGGHAFLTNWFDNGTGNVGVTRLSNPANDFLAGRIFVNRGTLALTADGVLGNSANPLTPAANATVRFDAPSFALAHPINAVANPTYLDMFGDNNGDAVPETLNNVTISGIISGAGAIFPRGTNGLLTLSGANTISGGFELQQPLTLQVGASANLGTAYVAIKFGSTFRYTGSGSETMTRSLWMDNNGGGTIDIPNASAVLTWNPGGGTLNQPLTKTGAGTLIYGTQGITGGLLTVNAGAMTVNSVISGATTQVRVNSGTLTLNGTNTYTGTTLVNGGTLLVNGSLALGTAVTVASGGTLGGNGTINAPTVVQVGGILAPGVGGIGRLTVANALNLGGSTLMEINKASNTNDSIVSVSSIVYGGSLVVNNLGGDLAAGDSFKLFSAWAYFGSFASITLPPLINGYAWDTSGLLVDGTIKVISSAPPVVSSPTVLPDGNFQLTLTGTVGQAYTIRASTNAAQALSLWTVLQSSTLPSSTYTYSDLTATNFGMRFYIISTP